MRQAEKQRQQLWKLSVRAEFKNFNFRLKATKISPTWKFHRFSILLKLHNFLLHLRSDSENPSFSAHQRTTLKSRFLAAVRKLRPRRSKNHPVTEVTSPINRLKHFAYELRKNIPEKSTTVLTLSVVATVIATAVRSGLDFRFMNYDYHHRDWISEFIRKAWNKFDLLQHLQE